MQSPHRVSLTSHGVVGTHAMIWAWRHSWGELESTSGVSPVIDRVVLV
jgi:hypothetical protein